MFSSSITTIFSANSLGCRHAWRIDWIERKVTENAEHAWTSVEEIKRGVGQSTWTGMWFSLFYIFHILLFIPYIFFFSHIFIFTLQLPNDSSQDDSFSLDEFGPRLVSVNTRSLINIWIPSAFAQGKTNVHHTYQVSKSRPVLSRSIPSRPVSSRLVPSRPFSFLHVPSHPFTSLLIPSRPVSSRLVPSHPFTSRLIPSRPVSSLPIPSRPFSSLHFHRLGICSNQRWRVEYL